MLIYKRLEASVLLGAILGDMIGSLYEFRNIKRKDFPLFVAKSVFTDDTVMSLAVAEAMMNGGRDREATAREVVKSMQKLGRMYPKAGYGGMFRKWLASDTPAPYGSYGNGSAMRVSSVGWLFATLEDTLDYAAISASVTHNHPEGVKWAQAVAGAIFLARTGEGKPGIKAFVQEHTGAPLALTCDEIRPGYRFSGTCQGSVPEAFTAFLEAADFEDTVRTAVSLGGDSDTIAAIAGSVAEAFFGIPDGFRDEAIARLDAPLVDILERFERFLNERSQA